MATGRGGPGGSQTIPAPIPELEALPDPKTKIGAKCLPVPGPDGSLIPVGALMVLVSVSSRCHGVTARSPGADSPIRNRKRD
jgi:hypothetical protein